MFQEHPGKMSMESPFKRKKVIFQRENSCAKTAVIKIFSQLDDLFVESIPSEDVKQLPPKYLYPIGLLVLLVLLAIFVAVFVPGYTALVKTKFLSPVEGDSSSKFCDDVTISNTGSYLATQVGYWQGSSTFSYSNATYSLTLANVEMDTSSYAYQMQKVFAELQIIGSVAKHNDLATNLLYWMSWVYVGSAEQRFTLSGTPLMIFNREHTVGMVSNYYGDCDAPSSSSFNPSTGIMEMSYALSDYTNNSLCVANGLPDQFGYTTVSRTRDFSVKIDIRTLITVAAVNSLITKPSDLQIVDETYHIVANTSYYSASYVDPRYPGMQPTLCLFNNGIPSCLLSVGNMYGLPILNHIGANLTFPEPCNCTVQLSLGVNKVEAYHNLCNQFNFLTSIMYWPGANTSDPNAALEMLLAYSAQDITRLAYPPMFSAGAYGVASPNRSSFNSPAQREAMYSFCNLSPYGPCSLLTFSSFDSTDSLRVVSSNFFTMDYGACADTMSTSKTEWSRLISAPFAPLTQQYQTCSNDPVTAFFTQVGVSAGNVTLLSPLGVMLVLGILALYQHCTGRYIPRTYGSAEKAQALEAVAVALLLVRDQRVKARRSKSSSAPSEQNTKQDQEHAQEKELEQEQDLDSYEVGLLADIVEQLGNIAPAAESQHYLYREESQSEPVTIDWKNLSTKIIDPTGQQQQRDRADMRTRHRGTEVGTELTAVQTDGSSA